jgi:hypothetical protein
MAASHPKPLAAATLSAAVPMVILRSLARFRERASRAESIVFMTLMVAVSPFAHMTFGMWLLTGRMLAACPETDPRGPA